MSGLGHRGSSRGHVERWLSGTFMCGRPECNATASNVPDGESNYQRGAGAFLSVLIRDWGYANVKGYDPYFGDFWDQNFHVFIWRDLEGNISGNQLLGLLNIVPARNFGISLHFSCSENWFLYEFVRWYFAILELWLLGISVYGGVVLMLLDLN